MCLGMAASKDFLDRAVFAPILTKEQLDISTERQRIEQKPSANHCDSIGHCSRRREGDGRRDRLSRAGQWVRLLIFETPTPEPAAEEAAGFFVTL